MTASGGLTPRRLGGFILVPALSALAPLVVLPAITGAFGGPTWAAVALAQSVGSAGAVLVELGWGLNGPQRVARATERNRGQLYTVALATKVAITVLLLGPIALITTLLAPIEADNARLVAIGYLLTGLSPVWFFIGEGRPSRILLYDAVPRLLTALVPAALIAFVGAPLSVYAVGLLVGGLLPPLLGLLISGAKLGYLRRYRVARLQRLVRAQGVALGGRAASALYIALPITLVGIAAPAALVVFSATERMMRLGLSLLSSVPNSLQAWVGAPPATAQQERQRRVMRSLVFNALLGLVAAGTFTALAPLASSILFSGTANVGHGEAAVAGVVVFITCISRATGGLGLVAYRQVPAIAASAVVGALVGVPSILLLARLDGVRGAFIGEILAETCVLVVQVYALARAGAFRRH